MIINRLQLKNFKCFKETDIDFGKITLLTGANSSGKSSFIDALLAVMQTDKFPLYFSPNGKNKNIGGWENISHRGDSELIEVNIDFSSLLNQYLDRDDLGVFKIDKRDLSIETTWQKSEKSAMPTLKCMRYKLFHNNKEYITDFFQKKHTYIIEPDYFDEFPEYSKIKDAEEDVKLLILSKEEKEFYSNEVEYPVEFLSEKFNYIHSYREEPQTNYYQVAKTEDKIYPNGNGYAQQIADWEEIDPEKIELLIKYLKGLKLVHSIKTAKREDGTFKILVKVKEKSIFVPLTDVGFGVSKILPILVADLQLDSETSFFYNQKIDKRSLLVLSEPEIDLHPSVQADFADYLVKQTKENQKQYIVETHSEYIINRLRLLIARGTLKEEDVKLYFFENDGIESKTFPVKLHKDGQITNAPDSFFETYTIDIMEIALNSFDDE